MASGFAKVTLIGNLGADPEVRFSAGGTAVCNLRVACTERVKNGEAWEDRTEWVHVVCFGKTAESAGQYLAKGRQVYVEGRMQTREWEKDGFKRYTTEVVANTVLFLGGPKSDDGAAHPTKPPVRSASPRPSADDAPF